MRLTTKHLLPWLALNGIASAGRKHNKPDEMRFKTEPSYDLVNLDLKIFPNDTSSLAKGYMFISNERGPQIFDIYGDLVWYRHVHAQFKVQDFKVCPYLGEEDTHLCWHSTSLKDGRQNTARKAYNVVVDASYKELARISRGIGSSGPNLHFFTPVEGGKTFLQPVYVPKTRDLRPFKGPQNGKIWDGCFQEIDFTTRKELFRWCASDHFQLWETSIFFTALNGVDAPRGQKNATSPKAGRATGGFPFDFFHINAIHKDVENNYVISSRHFDQIVKLAGPKNTHGLKPGSIIWRMGGKGNQFEMKDFSFHKQHAIRLLSLGATESVFSLFDNEWEGSVKPHRRFSSGQIIKVNNESMEAELLREYPHPRKKLSGSQGDMQVLPNGNAFVGWGRRPELSEFAEDGTCIYHAAFRTNEYNPNSYRAWKMEWVGRPVTKPKLLAYARDCRKTSPLVAYVSWNGATEVYSWRFHVATRRVGPWITAGEFVKDGFETEAELSSKEWLSPFMPYVSVEAVDSEGNILSSTISRTWVPNSKLKSDCDKKGCLHNTHFEYKRSLSNAQRCTRSEMPAIIAFTICVLFIEALSYSSRTISVWILDKLKHRREKASGEAAYQTLAPMGPVDSKTTEED